jgi:hypothetical protein
MTYRITLSALLLALIAQTAQAAPPKNAVLIDHSTATLIDAVTAQKMLAEGIPARVWKLYPASKWGYVTEVEGGFNSAGICVVTARAMMMQLTPTIKAMLYRPKKTSTAFDALPSATQEQCKELARAKLREAIASVMSGLVS